MSRLLFLIGWVRSLFRREPRELTAEDLGIEKEIKQLEERVATGTTEATIAEHNQRTELPRFAPKMCACGRGLVSDRKCPRGMVCGSGTCRLCCDLCACTIAPNDPGPSGPNPYPQGDRSAHRQDHCGRPTRDRAATGDASRDPPGNAEPRSQTTESASKSAQQIEPECDPGWRLLGAPRIDGSTAWTIRAGPNLKSFACWAEVRRAAAERRRSIQWEDPSGALVDFALDKGKPGSGMICLTTAFVRIELRESVAEVQITGLAADLEGVEAWFLREMPRAVWWLFGRIGADGTAAEIANALALIGVEQKRLEICLDIAGWQIASGVERGLVSRARFSADWRDNDADQLDSFGAGKRSSTPNSIEIYDVIARIGAQRKPREALLERWRRHGWVSFYEWAYAFSTDERDNMVAAGWTAGARVRPDYRAGRPLACVVSYDPTSEDCQEPPRQGDGSILCATCGQGFEWAMCRKIQDPVTRIEIRIWGEALRLLDEDGQQLDATHPGAALDTELLGKLWIDGLTRHRLVEPRQSYWDRLERWKQNGAMKRDKPRKREEPEHPIWTAARGAAGRPDEAPKLVRDAAARQLDAARRRALERLGKLGAEIEVLLGGDGDGEKLRTALDRLMSDPNWDQDLTRARARFAELLEQAKGAETLRRDE